MLQGYYTPAAMPHKRRRAMHVHEVDQIAPMHSAFDFSEEPTYYSFSSRARDNKQHPTPEAFQIRLETPLRNVRYIAVRNIELPNTKYNIGTSNNVLYFSEADDGTNAPTTFTVVVPVGSYTTNELVSVLNNLVNGAVPYTAAADTIQGTKSPRTGSPENTYTFSYNSVSGKICMKATTLTRGYSLHAPPFNRKQTIDVTGVSLSDGAVDLLTVYTKEPHNIAGNAVVNIELYDTSGNSFSLTNQPVYVDVDGGSTTPNSGSFVVEIANGSFSSMTLTDTITGTVRPLAATNNIALSLGFVTSRDVASGYEAPTIVAVDETGASATRYFTTNAPHCLAVGNAITFANLASKEAGTNPDTVLAVVDNYTFTATTNDAITVTQLGLTPSPTVSYLGAYTGDEKVDMRNPTIMFLRMCANNQYDIGRIINKSSCDLSANESKYMARVFVNTDLNDTAFTDGDRNVIGADYLQAPINKLQTIFFELLDENNERVDLNGVEWSIGVDILGETPSH